MDKDELTVSSTTRNGMNTAMKTITEETTSACSASKVDIKRIIESGMISLRKLLCKKLSLVQYEPRTANEGLRTTTGQPSFGSISGYDTKAMIFRDLIKQGGYSPVHFVVLQFDIQ